MNELIDRSESLGCHLVPPLPRDRLCPAHFPRDEERTGRQIDVIMGRMIDHSKLGIDPDRRLVIGTGHAFLHIDIYKQGLPATKQWGTDSRARWVNKMLPDTEIVDEEDIIELAKHCSAPRTSLAYKDPVEVLDLIATAKLSNHKQDWKAATKLVVKLEEDGNVIAFQACLLAIGRNSDSCKGKSFPRKDGGEAFSLTSPPMS